MLVYRSTARGRSHPVQSVRVEAGEPGEVELTLPLNQFVDGGWYWFDIAAGARRRRAGPGRVGGARPTRQRQGMLSIGITTFNRPDFCVDGLRVLASAPDVLDIVDTIYVVDQGTQRVADHPDYTEAVKGLDGRLQVIVQGNLGGSGGFSRAMDETVAAGTSDYVLLLDDDVVTEPESIVRAATFADLARRPTIVGGHMFSLYDRSVLHAFGESVARYNWWWGSAPNTRSEHDFGRQSLRHTPWLHRRVDVDYNGWWMCLLPVSVVRELGLSLPVFIKWDDAEYGLRASEAGYPTVSMPGVAVWHVPWQDKNDALDWQAYFHLRNRLVAALLHSPYPHGGSIVTENLQFQLRHLLSMQYSTAELRLMAVRDVLSGPDHLHRELPGKLGELRAMRSEYSDSSMRPDPEQFPTVKRRKPPKRGKEPTSPANKLDLMVRAALGVVRQVRPTARARPAPPRDRGPEPGRRVVGAGQRRQRARVQPRRHRHGLVPARQRAVPRHVGAQRPGVRPAVAGVEPAGAAVPRRGAGVHVLGELAGHHRGHHAERRRRLTCRCAAAWRPASNASRTPSSATSPSAASSAPRAASTPAGERSSTCRPAASMRPAPPSTARRRCSWSPR